MVQHPNYENRGPVNANTPRCERCGTRYWHAWVEGRACPDCPVCQSNDVCKQQYVENLFRTRSDQGLETHLFDVVIDLEQHDLGNPLSAAAARAVIAVEDAFTDYANADLNTTEPGETNNGPAPEL